MGTESEGVKSNHDCAVKRQAEPKDTKTHLWQVFEFIFLSFFG